MALKTQPTRQPVGEFIKSIDDPEQRRDCRALMKIFREVTQKRPRMWGSSIVGYGEYHYKYASGREGDWPVTGFSPRKRNLTVYIMNGFSKYGALMKRLGKHKTAKSCLYIRRLDDIDQKVLKELIRRSIRDMARIYTVK